MNPAKKLLLTLVASCAAAALASAVTITSNSTIAYTRGTAGPTASSAFTGTSIPTSHLLDLTQGDYFARDQIDYTGSGDNVTLLNTLSNARSGTFGDYSYVESTLSFTVASNTDYFLSGAFSALDATTAGYIVIQSFLRDLTTATTLYNNDQYSGNTMNESFVLGGSGGDLGNDSFGSATGALIAGHLYRWYSVGLIQAYPDADGGATATGFFRLDIGGGAPTSASVPDGGTTLAMFGLAVLSLAAGRRKVTRA